MPWMSLSLFYCLVGLCLPSNSFAYIDPGTGSLIMQALIAAGITALAFFHGLRVKIVNLFKRIFHHKRSDKDE